MEIFPLCAVLFFRVNIFHIEKVIKAEERLHYNPLINSNQSDIYIRIHVSFIMDIKPSSSYPLSFTPQTPFKGSARN